MNKNIIITGGAKGIGKALAKNLAIDGYNVFVNYNKSEEAAKQLQKELRLQGINIILHKADISKKDEATKMVRTAIQDLKKIDVLINNAGISKIQLFMDITDADWNTMISTNLNSIFYTTQAAAYNMVQRKNGSIINISSIWGLVGSSCEVAYSTSKARGNWFYKSFSKGTPVHQIFA